MKSLDSAAKAVLLVCLAILAGWFIHRFQYGGEVGEALAEQRDTLARSRAGTSPGDAMREAVQAKNADFTAYIEADKTDLEQSRKLGEARPRNVEACDKLTMDAPAWKMRMLGCLPAGEYPPAILERGELVRLDDALRQVNRSPTVAGLVADYPRDEAFCSKATTATPRVDTWRNGCVPWGVDPRITRFPVVPLDRALKAAKIEPTKAGPIPEQMPRNAAYCDKARNTDNPLQLWRNGCLRRGQFPPSVDPEMSIDAAMQEGAPAG
ncbi:hypothetical protein XacyCFBP2565_21935 [Xanthomonas arboricola pv. corylina]|uniref:hypothetical protein n=1 Tax=Xanthomonas arboricola TaxID=56448 RepID=UPI000CED8A4D|nr:hypothetical protein [Xanthomonas arboricola]PPU05225.1 hypothetical protein XacyCFBP2565_21935 [Xanthomonas arboricola pv. corylina]